ncbi:putative ribonuclease H-like domain-containing protein [Tanacetum coccineum]
MDLLGLTSVRSINHKTYCLIVTDDFSSFSWGFFLASKDKTSGILKKFITEIENQLNHKVKVIRCDNGIEFKNREMNELFGLKGIKRKFSVAKTPQQNGVAERKNMTLIEAARTMLPDSLLLTVFWAKTVNTACYVPNRVLMTKPHNKTPYELIIGRPPSISFMRHFGCPVTILNTLDPLGKFDGKAEEGFLVGYSVNSKAFRVFNSQTRKVEENMHVNFLENKPNVAGHGPNWLFDIDSLTNSMNYQPVTAGNQTNKNAGPQEANGDTSLKKSVDARQSEEKNVSTQQYIVFPLWSFISSSYKSSDENDKANDSAGEPPVQKPANENEQALKNVLDKMIDQEKEATKQSNAVRKEFEAQCNRELLQGKATKASNTNSFNTVSTPVNAANAPRTSNDAGSSSVPLGRSFPLNVNDLLDTMGGAPAQTRSERVLEKHNEPPLSQGYTFRSGEGSMEHQFELTANVPITPNDSPLLGGYTPGSNKGRLKLHELMTMCTKLSKQVLDLKKKKDAQAVEILRLKKRVKGLERQRKSSTSQPRRRKYRHVESSDDDLNEEDASKQGRRNDKTKQ